MRTNPKGPLFLCAIAVAFMVLLCICEGIFASEEFVRSEQGNLSGQIRKFQLYTPANLAGAATIETGQANACQVDLECWARARNRKMAEEFTELVEMKLDITDRTATLRITTPRDAPWEGTNYAVKATAVIYLPPEIAVETKTRHFSLDIHGPLESASVENDYGEITVTDILQETSIRGTYNKVEVQNLQGKVDIETSYNSIRARDVDTKGDKAMFETLHGKIEVDRFKGQLEAITSYSPVDASGISLIGGSSKISTVHSKIDLLIDELEDCKLFVSNSYGNINVRAPEDLSAKLSFSVGRGGKIETNRILIRPTVLQRTSLKGTCGEGDSEIELEIDGIGTILLEAR